MKKVLIITYYWPPCGGIGVLRCLKFAKYLRHYGWEPIIFTAEGAHYPSIDHTNEKDIPENITVLRQKIWEPYHIYKFITRQKQDANVNNVFYATEKKPGPLHNLSVWIRSNFFIPDARALWIKPSVTFLLDYLKENPVDALLSNGPPHSNTRIANLIKKKTGLPWLADFQDPWSQVDYFSMLKLTPWGRKKHLRMEQEVFRDANAISIVSKAWKKDLESIGAKNVQVLPWGFDRDDFEGLDAQPDPFFSITHIGILGSDRNPAELWQAIDNLSKEEPGLKKSLRVNLVGLVDTTVKNDITRWGLDEMVNFPGSLNRKAALGYANKSRVLLLMLNRQENAAGRIPGKLFEYLAVGKPILAIGPPDSDVAEILAQTGNNFYCNFGDIDATIEALKRVFRKFIQNDDSFSNQHNPEQFTNKAITGQLAAILDKITKGQKPL